MRREGTRRRGSPAVAALAIGLAASCGVPAENVPCTTTEDAVVATLDAVMAADTAEDVDAAVDFYTETVTWILPDGEVVTGREAIAERYRQTFDLFDVTVAADASTVEFDGARATILGTTTGVLAPRDDGAPFEIDDAFVMQLVCSPDATWRVSHLAWSRQGDEEDDGSVEAAEPEDATAAPGS